MFKKMLCMKAPYVVFNDDNIEEEELKKSNLKQSMYQK